MTEMKKGNLTLSFAIACTALAGTGGAQDLQQKLASAKQAAARNQQSLRSYSWVAKTEISSKGEVKSTKVEAWR